MAGEWTLTTLGEIAQLHEEQVTPASTPDAVFHHFSIPAFDAGRTPVVEIGSAIGSNKFVVPRDAVLVSKLNPRIPRVWEPDVPTGARAVASTEFLVLRPSNLVDRRFLRFLCLGPTIRAEMEARVTGTSGSHQRVRPEDALAIPVEIPVDLPEQRAIAHILGTLDDKIELNRRMSETLEAMARALFKSWFVDFDPVRAKAEGRDPGLPQPLADLFPDSFEDSEGVGGGELVDLTMNPERDAADTIVGTVRPGNGSYALIFEDGLTGSTGFAVLRPRTARYAEFVYLAATAADNIDTLAHLADGAAYPAVRPEVVAATPIVRPSNEVFGWFSRVAGALLAKRAQNERESSTLAALRDALLPKLISGELRVKDAEKFIERAAL
jgi:type I restriction enzyme S subunit